MYIVQCQLCCHLYLLKAGAIMYRTCSVSLQDFVYAAKVTLVCLSLVQTLRCKIALSHIPTHFVTVHI